MSAMDRENEDSNVFVINFNEEDGYDNENGFGDIGLVSPASPRTTTSAASSADDEVPRRPKQYRICPSTANNDEEETELTNSVYQKDIVSTEESSIQDGRPLQYAPISFLYSIDVLKKDSFIDGDSIMLDDSTHKAITSAVSRAVLDSLYDNVCPQNSNSKNSNSNKNSSRLDVRTISKWTLNEFRGDCQATFDATKCDEFSGSVLVGFDTMGLGTVSSDFTTVGETVLSQIETDMDDGAYLDQINLHLDTFDLTAVRMQYITSNYFNMADKGVFTPVDVDAGQTFSQQGNKGDSSTSITPFGMAAISIIGLLSIMLCWAVSMSYITRPRPRRLIQKTPLVVVEEGSVSSISLKGQKTNDRTLVSVEVDDLERRSSTMDVQEPNCTNSEASQNQDLSSPSMRKMAALYKDNTGLQVQEKNRSIEIKLERNSDLRPYDMANSRVYASMPVAPATRRRGLSPPPILSFKKEESMVVNIVKEDETCLNDDPTQVTFVEAQENPTVLSSFNDARQVQSPILSEEFGDDDDDLPSLTPSLFSYLYGTEKSKADACIKQVEKFDDEYIDPGQNKINCDTVEDASMKIVGIFKDLEDPSSRKSFDSAPEVHLKSEATSSDHQNEILSSTGIASLPIFRRLPPKPPSSERPTCTSDTSTSGQSQKCGLYPYYSHLSEESLSCPRTNRSSISHGNYNTSQGKPNLGEMQLLGSQLFGGDGRSNGMDKDRDSSAGIPSSLAVNYSMRRHRSLVDDEDDKQIPLEFGMRRSRTDEQGKVRQEIAL